MFYLFGVPKRIITDRGTALTSHSFKVFCETYGIRHTLNAVATSRAYGQCERYNGTIVNALAATSAGKAEDEWDTPIKTIQSAMNCTFNRSLGPSPLEALAGYKPRHVADSNILTVVQENLNRLDLVELRSAIKHKITEDQKAQKERFDEARCFATIYNEGNLVMVAQATPSTGTSRKLLPKYPIISLKLRT